MVANSSSPVVSVALDLIDPWDHNPRQDPDEAKIVELAANLLVEGQIQPLIVRAHPSATGRYQLADGSRRRVALLRNKAPQADVRIRALNDEQMLAIALSTGTGSEPLTPLDEGRGYEEALKIWKNPDGTAVSEREVARRLGKPVWLVQQRRALLQLPDESRKAVAKGDLPATTAWLIARVPGPKKFEAEQGVMHGAVGGGILPYASAKKFIEERICRSLKGAPFNSEDADLVPEAGVCSKCPYRSKNNPDLYTDIRDDKCMNPSCFEQKVVASRARVLAKEAKDGKEALPPEINALVFPAGDKVMSWKSDYVAFTQPITRDLLKPEVTRVPTWASLCEGVKVYVGIDQEGRAVDVVKLSEALAAVPQDETAIFSDDVARRHGLARPSRNATAGGKSRAEEEETERILREKAERSAKKRNRKSREWLDELATSLEGMAASGKPAWASYDYWSLMFELMLKALGDEDVTFVCELFGIDSEIDLPAMSARRVLADFVGRISKDRCGALVTAMSLAPWLRAEGPDAPFVTDWHDAFIAEKPAEEEPVKEKSEAGPDEKVSEPAKPAAAVAPVPTISAQESSQLAQLVKAYDGGDGMSPQRLASEFKMPIEEVCGALELDVHAVRNVAAQLRQDLEEAFATAKLTTSGVRNRVVKTATAGRAATEADIAWPEDFRSLLRILSQKAPPPAKPAANDSE